MDRHGVEHPPEHATRTVARHLTILDSLRCTVCGSSVGAPCDIVAHQVWGVATFACTHCGAGVGEPCEPDCQPDRVLGFIMDNLVAG